MSLCEKHGKIGFVKIAIVIPDDDEIIKAIQRAQTIWGHQDDMTDALRDMCHDWLSGKSASLPEDGMAMSVDELLGLDD